MATSSSYVIILSLGPLIRSLLLLLPPNSISKRQRLIKNNKFNLLLFLLFLYITFPVRQLVFVRPGVARLPPIAVILSLTQLTHILIGLSLVVSPCTSICNTLIPKYFVVVVLTQPYHCSIHSCLFFNIEATFVDIRIMLFMMTLSTFSQSTCLTFSFLLHLGFSYCTGHVSALYIIVRLTTLCTLFP